MHTAILFLAASGTARAQVLCDTGERHGSITAALADTGCAEIRLEPGVHREEVTVRRSVAITGEGAEGTWLVCDDGPCITALPGVAVAIRDLTLAADETAFASWLSLATFERVVITSIGPRGGWVALNHTDARLHDVEIDVGGRRPLQLNALSTRGHDLELESARFFGTEPASGTQSALYSIGYGVSCTNCSFHPERPRRQPPEPLLELDDSLHSVPELETREARWPQLYCPAPDASHRRACAEQCAEGEEIAQCRMAWDEPTESCTPSAVCVPSGERMPTVEIERVPRSRGFR